MSAKLRLVQADLWETDPDNPSEKEAKKLLNEARKYLQKVKLKAKKLCDDFLVKRAEMYTKLGEMSKAKKCS